MRVPFFLACAALLVALAALHLNACTAATTPLPRTRTRTRTRTHTDIDTGAAMYMHVDAPLAAQTQAEAAAAAALYDRVIKSLSNEPLAIDSDIDSDMGRGSNSGPAPPPPCWYRAPDGAFFNFSGIANLTGSEFRADANWPEIVSINACGGPIGQ
jgi:hypothetical protein